MTGSGLAGLPCARCWGRGCFCDAFPEFLLEVAACPWSEVVGAATFVTWSYDMHVMMTQFLQGRSLRAP